MSPSQVQKWTVPTVQQLHFFPTRKKAVGTASVAAFETEGSQWEPP